MQFIFESQPFLRDSGKVKDSFAGMQLMAKLAHKHHIPVTWLTNYQGAEAASDMFTQYHQDLEMMFFMVDALSAIQKRSI